MEFPLWSYNGFLLLDWAFNLPTEGEFLLPTTSNEKVLGQITEILVNETLRNTLKNVESTREITLKRSSSSYSDRQQYIK